MTRKIGNEIEELENEMDKEYISEEEWLHSEEINSTINYKSNEFIPIKGNFKINEQIIKATIDTGAITSIITDKLRRKIGLEIEESSNETYKIANGQIVSSLGKLSMILEFETNR